MRAKELYVTDNDALPKISVVVPIYNTVDQLEQCLTSIRNQTMEDFEVLCIDDASTDGSARIIDAFAQQDCRFKKLSNDQNQGAGAARNRGIDAARGTYVAFLDSDDLIDCTMLEKSYRHSVETDADICCFPLSFYYPSRNAIEEFPPSLDFSLLPAELKEPFPASVAGGAAFIFANPSVCTKIFKRDFLSRTHAHFTDHRIAEDLLFTFTAFSRTERIAVLHDYVYYYNQEKPTSISKEPANMTALLHALDMLYQRLVDFNLLERYKNPFANLFLYHVGGVLSLMKEEESLEKAFAECAKWKDRLQLLDYQPLFPAYEVTYRNICFGTPVSYLLDIVKSQENTMERTREYYGSIEKELRELLAEQEKLQVGLITANESLRKELDEVMQSRSFRLGSALLRVPSAIKSRLIRR